MVTGLHNPGAVPPVSSALIRVELLAPASLACSPPIPEAVSSGDIGMAATGGVDNGIDAEARAPSPEPPPADEPPPDGSSDPEPPPGVPEGLDGAPEPEAALEDPAPEAAPVGDPPLEEPPPEEPPPPGSGDEAGPEPGGDASATWEPPPLPDPPPPEPPPPAPPAGAAEGPAAGASGPPDEPPGDGDGPVATGGGDGAPPEPEDGGAPDPPPGAVPGAPPAPSGAEATSDGPEPGKASTRRSNVVLSCCPVAASALMITTPMSAATSAYSIAVTPASDQVDGCVALLSPRMSAPRSSRRSMSIVQVIQRIYGRGS